jgi:hypothetical protein
MPGWKRDNNCMMKRKLSLMSNKLPRKMKVEKHQLRMERKRQKKIHSYQSLIQKLSS